MKKKQGRKSPEDVVDAETMSDVYISNIVTNPGSDSPIQYLEERGTGHATVLGSKQRATGIREVVRDHATDNAFKSFRSRIAGAVQAFGFTPSGVTYTINDSHEVQHLYNSSRSHQTY